MRDFRLEFSPFSFIMLHEGEVCKQVNEHSDAYVKGIIHQSDVAAYRDMSLRDEHTPFSITAVTDGGAEVIVFQGVTTCIEIEQMGQVATMTVRAKSGSYLMDIDERFRTFQDPDVTCSEVLELCGETYADYNYILKTPDMPLGQFTVQYWETDWAFAKRLASRQNEFLVPADTFPGTRYYFGVPHLTGYVFDDSIDFTIVRDCGATDRKRRQGLKDADERDAISYVVEHRDIFAVGDLVQFQGRDLYIDRAVTAFSGQQLVHRYHMRPKSGLRTAMCYNERMIGASLDGQVLDVRRDEVQVQVTDDENTDQTIVQWFPFATVYSSPDGTGWYCMPEVGDQVRLYIPDKEESHAVAFNALHVASEARNNPDIKSMRNKFGKEIRFTPNTLVMTNNTGMEISIIDGEGIRIESNKNIFVKADGNIDISCSAGLSMLAGDAVVVEQSGTSLVVDDNVSFVGGRLRMQ